MSANNKYGSISEGNKLTKLEMESLIIISSPVRWIAAPIGRNAAITIITCQWIELYASFGVITFESSNAITPSMTPTTIGIISKIANVTASNIDAKLSHQKGCPSSDPSTLPRTINPSLLASWFILSLDHKLIKYQKALK